MKNLLILCFLSIPITLSAQYKLVNPFPTLGTFSRPVDLATANDGSGRLFIVEQRGRIIEIRTRPTVSSSIFLNLSDIVSQSGGETGLLGLAFDPNFASNKRFYVNYTTSTRTGKLTTYVSRFFYLSDTTSRKASEKILFSVEQPYENHNGGCIKFGPDGFLYISLGDGGSGGDPGNRAQNNSSFLGKILRINVNDSTQSLPYKIPPGNPFIGNLKGYKEEIFAYGLRNVWRMSFDRMTGKLWGGDVGQGAWEEVDIIENGKNYGWRIMEGNHCYNPSSNCDTTGLVKPVIEYPHTNGDASITGGYVYRGERLPTLYGKYFYGDYATGRIWAADVSNPSSTNLLFIDRSSPAILISSFGEDEDGELYLCVYGTSGRILKLTAENELSAPILIAPMNDSTIRVKTIECSWQPVNGAAEYEIQISKDSNFSSFIINTKVSSVNIQVTLPENQTEYYWRVRAANSVSKSIWSEIRNFRTVFNGTTPPAPTLLFPDDNAHLRSYELDFIWSSVPNADRYMFKLAEDEHFTGQLFDSVFIGDTLFHPTNIIFQHNKPYWWSVRACNTADDCGEWSPARSFTIDTFSRVYIDNANDQFITILRIDPNHVICQLVLSKSTSTFVTLNDVSGKQIVSDRYDLVQGNNEISINMNTLSSGLYFIDFRMGNVHYRLKFVK